jgi:hypothetical protein
MQYIWVPRKSLLVFKGCYELTAVCYAPVGTEGGKKSQQVALYMSFQHKKSLHDHAASCELTLVN